MKTRSEISAVLTPEDVPTISDYRTAVDFDLAQSVAKGDMIAFEEIYRRYHRRVYVHCLKMLKNEAMADDLTQDIFVQIYRKIGNFRGESKFTTWLHRVTVNEVLMHFRKKSVKFEKTTDDEELPERPVLGTENPSKMQIVDRISLETAIKGLPPGYKKVFILHDIEGFQHEEVARIMGLSTGTSKSQLHKARLKLRGLLQQETKPKQPAFA